MEENETLIHVTGDAFNVAFQVNGLNFAGLNVKSAFKKSIDQSSADVTFQDSDGSIVVNIISATQAVLTFNKNSTDAAAFVYGTYKYDIQISTNANDVQTICFGTLKVVKQITT